MSNLWTLPIRLIGKMASQLSTESEVEESLNSCFSGRTYDVETYEGKTVRLEVSTITVRPRVKHGRMPEMDYILTADPQVEATQKEQITSIISNEWMTIPHLKVHEGEPQDLKPSGLSFFLASHVSSPAVAGEQEIMTRSVRINDEHEMYSDRLETQIIYDGSTPEYERKLNKVVDNVQYIQKNMHEVAKNCLMNLYSPIDDAWDDEEMARNLVSYLFDDEVPFEIVEYNVRHLWEEGPDEESG